MSWPILFGITAFLSIVLAAISLWLYQQRKTLGDRYRQQVDSYKTEITDFKTEIDRSKEKVAGLERDLAVAEEKQRGMTENFESAQRKSQQTFDSLAGKALKSVSDQFLQLAKKTFEGEQKDATAQLEQQKQAIDALIKPVRESLDKHAKAVTDIEKNREGAYHSLRQQITSMVEGQRLLHKETDNLVKALRRPEVRGRWGELVIERVLELAGMTQYCHDSQVTSPDGSLRVDKIVRLPSDRNIVIDVKTNADAYLSAIETDDAVQQDAHLARHVKQIEDTVRELSSKRYQDHYPCADFIVMFIPGEPFLQAAAQRKPTLVEDAMERGVVIATPSTLVALLKAVAMGWREVKLADNARRISELGVELHERIATMVGHVEKCGGHLEKAVNAYNDLVGSLDTRVLVSARKFKGLEADSRKELPAEGQVKQIDIQPRAVQSSP